MFLLNHFFFFCEFYSRHTKGKTKNNKNLTRKSVVSIYYQRLVANENTVKVEWDNRFDYFRSSDLCRSLREGDNIHSTVLRLFVQDFKTRTTQKRGTTLFFSETKGWTVGNFFTESVEVPEISILIYIGWLLKKNIILIFIC